jgi:2-(1,2-epoxy-1,2-dihydrophenyl)acetyl-CoA isomerase
MGQHTLVSVENKIGTVTINRPDLGNAFTKETFAEVREDVESLAANNDVNCIVITGAGRFFSTGGDITWFKGMVEKGEVFTEADMRVASDMALAIAKCPLPVIAMVNGAAAGAGFSLAAACDFRVVTEKSTFVMAFINVGLPVDTLGFYNLTKIVGLNRARELSFTARPVGGKEALAIGLADRLAEEDKLAETTMALARQLADMPLMVIRKQKEMIAKFFRSDVEDFIKIESKNFVECFPSADVKEAVNAFLEKRKPKFTCR